MQDDLFDNWIADLRSCDDAAVERLWENYFARLTGYARTRLPSGQRRDFDEEDVVLSAIDSFCRGMQRGRFPSLADEGNLWALLVLITARKAAHRVRDARAQKRGGGVVRGESVFSDGKRGSIQDVIGGEPSPDFAAAMFEETDRLCAALPDRDLQTIAILKMEGLTNREVAEKLGCVERTIERRLRLIRQYWINETTSEQ